MTEIEFITKDGLKSAKKAASHKIEGFLETVYFKEEVLKKYESNKDFKIGDDGTVLFGYEWGLFRGVYRVAKGFIAVNLGDLGEGFPNKELKHWKQHNIDPKSIAVANRYFDFRSEIKRMIYFMNQSNERIRNYLKKFFPEITAPNKNIFVFDNTENVLDHIKKVIDNKTTIDEFQSRIIFLNILLIESINVKLINQIFNQVDEDLNLGYVSVGLKECRDTFLKKETPEELKKYVDGTITPLKSLELLRKFLLFMRIHHDVVIERKIKTFANLNRRKNKLNQNIIKNFDSYYRYKTFNEDFPNRKYFNHYENTINESTAFLKLLNKFRNSSSAHGFNSDEYNKILRKLKISENEDDYSKVYETLISQVSYDLEHIYFNLILPDPPLKEHYEKYAEDSLLELKLSAGKYQSIFEDLFSYIQEFPELYSKIIIDVKKIYLIKQNNSDFLIELGSFIEYLSMVVKDKTQKLVDYITPGLKYEKALSIAHFSHIIKNSEKISPSFLKKTLPIVYEGVKDKKTINVSFCSEHVIFCLIEKCPEKLNKNQLRELFDGEKITFSLVKEFIR
ncbi:MAG: hypothetical protein V1866_00640 [archaeon]